MKPVLFAALVAAAMPFPSAIAAEASPTLTPNALVASVRAELEAMHETDQSQRKLITQVEKEHGQNSPEMRELWKKQTAIDEQNIKRLEEIIAAHGWPKRSVFGAKAASAAFLILQHSNLSYQKKYVALARAAVAAGEMQGSSLALLEDRILLREGKKQLYGSQVTRNAAGEWDVLPLEDEANVDRRRAAVGLPPLADYLQGFADRSGGKVADRKDDLAIEPAPPLTHTPLLFAATDDARAAHEKLKQIKPTRGEAAVQFQYACRDFCARFPRSSLYGDVRVLAARYAAWLSESELAQLEDWDPAAGEMDAKLTAEERAQVAWNVVLGSMARSGPSPTEGAADARLDTIAVALAPHRSTRVARDGLITAALDASPAKAILTLRETYPNDESVATAIPMLQQIGKPCDLQFTTIDGNAFDARTLRGKVVLVGFWTGGTGDWMTKLFDGAASVPMICLQRIRQAGNSGVRTCADLAAKP